MKTRMAFSMNVLSTYGSMYLNVLWINLCESLVTDCQVIYSEVQQNRWQVGNKTHNTNPVLFPNTVMANTSDTQAWLIFSWQNLEKYEFLFRASPLTHYSKGDG